MLELKRYTGSLVTPRDDALLYDFLINDTGVFEGLTVTHLGANQLLISAGRGIIKGRDFTAEEETILAQLSDSGEKKGRLLVRVDMSNEAAPIQFVTQVAASLPALVQEDINRGGTVYELPIAQYDVDELQISNLTYVAKKVLPQGGVYPATCTYSSSVFTLTGLPDNLPDIFTVRFKAPADFAEGDTFSINALPYALFLPNQQPAQAGAFAKNAVVSLNVDLATGKAFLPGGSGGMGEWERYPLTPISGAFDVDPIIYINKPLKLLAFGPQKLLQVTAATQARYNLPDGIFKQFERIDIGSGQGAGQSDSGETMYSMYSIYLFEGDLRIALFDNFPRIMVGADKTLKEASILIRNYRCNIHGCVKIPDEYWL